MVTAKGESRTVGVVYAVHNGKIYTSSKTDAWKVRHIRNNPHVSLTVPIAKRIPFLPWIKIPAATITFSGVAEAITPDSVSDDILQVLFRGMQSDSEMLAATSVISIEPVGDFVTYGVGIPMMEMRDTKKARGRAAVA
jgi:hypothetical protein